jgi:hypothetical protein
MELVVHCKKIVPEKWQANWLEHSLHDIGYGTFYIQSKTKKHELEVQGQVQTNKRTVLLIQLLSTNTNS